MERRYFVAGLVIIAVSATFTTYGVIASSSSVVGVSLSAIVAGAAIAFIGFSYEEPAEDILRQFIDDLSTFATRVLEDMGLIGGSKPRLCLGSKTLVFSERGVPCSAAPTGIGISDGVPYLGISIENSLKSIERFSDVEELVDRLKRVFVDVLRACRDVDVSGGGSEYVVEFRSVTSRGREYAKTPVNMFRILALAVVSTYTGLDCEIVEESMTRESYRIRIRAVGA